jgi:hypothetical protein
MEDGFSNSGRRALDHDDALDLDALLHPAQAFEHPMNVVNDPDLTLSEKRAILASWASDACAVEAAPAMRRARDGRTVRFDEIMDALRAIDRQAGSELRRQPRYRRVLERRRPGMFGRKSQGSTPDDQGPVLN